jgi:hypothetical protein
MVGLHWRKTDKGEGVTDWQGLCDNVKALPKGQLWRHNVAGDLPHTEQAVDFVLLSELVKANKGKKGFTYTHHAVLGNTPEAKYNAAKIKYSNSQGFTINLSANNLQHADELKALNIAPVVTLMPEDAPKVSTTPAGHTVIICPAAYREDVQCADCGICAEPQRKAIIGFPVHGTGKKKAYKVFTLSKA